MKRNAREAAFDVLYSIEQRKAYSNLALDRALFVPMEDLRDGARIKKITDGVIERKMTLDYQIRAHLTSSKIRIKPPVRVILRMGLYEILFCDGIPARASVNEYVELTKRRGFSHACGLVNAILRKAAVSGLLLPEKEAPEYLSVRYSCPPEFIALLRPVYGDKTEAFLSASLERPKIYGRVNTVRTDFDRLRRSLAAEDIDICRSEVLPEAFYFSGSAAFMRTEAFQRGWFHIQDLSSQLCCLALAAKPGQSVLDVCAAPGGKSFTISEEVGKTGSVLSCDIYDHKIELIEKGAQRLGLTNLSARLRNAASDDELREAFDRVLCDVPCSGMGVIRKKPEIKYRDLTAWRSLPALQAEILARSAALVKPGGRLIYSTCTVAKEENEEIVRAFLRENPAFTLGELSFTSMGRRGAYGLRLSPPEDDCDAFFIAPLIRSLYG